MTATPPLSVPKAGVPAAPALPAEVEQLLRRMRLPHIRRVAPEVIATARSQRWEPVEVLRVLLSEEVAGRERSAGADLPPYGLCHGQFDAAALHPTGRGDVYVLGWSRACIGPGLLDLVGALPLPDDGGTDALQEVIDDYLDAGGHRDAARTRGGLPAVRWAAGWGRVVQVERILGTVAAWLDQPTDAHHQDHVATLLHEAVQCLR